MRYARRSMTMAMSVNGTRDEPSEAVCKLKLDHGHVRVLGSRTVGQSGVKDSVYRGKEKLNELK